MRNALRSLAAAVSLGALGCGGSDVASLEIAVEYSGSAAEVSTNSLHLWVLEPAAASEEQVAAGCRELELGDAGPYDLDFDRHADVVILTAEATSGTVEDLPRRSVLVYVEGVNFAGVAHLAGCQVIELSSSSESITVGLRNRGALDCTDPETPDGAPCDDGLFCTVGETCQGGQCQGAVDRDCTHVADECNGESCSEELGCQPMPVPDTTPCFDGLFCTAGDTCQAGLCEPGGDRNCSDVVDDCNLAVCEEGASEAICTAVPTNEGGSCETECAVGGAKDGTCESGACVAPLEGETGPDDPTCSDEIDNDCDTLIDADDPDCQEPPA